MRARGLLGLAVAVLAISWGAPLARLAHAAPLAVAMWRMVLAAAMLAPVAALSARRPGAFRSWVVPAAVSSVLLGLHFALWIPSLWLTSVSASVVLVTTSPLWALLLSPLVLGTPIRGRSVITFAVAMAGIVVIVGGDLAASGRALLGDAMALAGAMCAAGYFVVGKRLRAEVPLVHYLAAVYAGAAVVLVVAVAALGVSPWPRDGMTWLVLFGLAVGPSLVGHSMLNWALAHFEAYQVNLAVLLEPLGAAALTWILLGERPPLHVVPGAALVLVALGWEFLAQRPLVPAVGGSTSDQLHEASRGVDDRG